ncbi:MAG TPA: ribosome maturation factor RimM [Actinomycetota bacterium]|nr:ribosome maturation factor RimM [Actinomycetota bacterium]
MDEPTIVVGTVGTAHGLRGEVAVQNRSDNPDRWQAGARVLLEDGRELAIEHARPHGRRMLVKFEGIDDRGRAEALRGANLVVPESWVPPLPEGEWWSHQVVGCEVRTESGRRLGIVTEVIANPANDLWVTVEAGSETLIPALADVLIEVDVERKRIVVRDVPGLTVPEDG